jgi:hypothetical protein
MGSILTRWSTNSSNVAKRALLALPVDHQKIGGLLQATTKHIDRLPLDESTGATRLGILKYIYEDILRNMDPIEWDAEGFMALIEKTGVEDFASFFVIRRLMCGPNMERDQDVLVYVSDG